MPNDYENAKIHIGRLSDPNAEKAVVGCLMGHGREAYAEMGHLAAEDFTSHASSELFKVLVKMFAAAERVDTVTVAAKLRERGLLESLGGLEWLTGLLEVTPTYQHITQYAAIVRDLSLHRQAVHQCLKSAEAMSTNPTDIAESIANTVAALNAISIPEQPTSMEAIMKECLAAMDAAKSGEGPAYTTGWPQFDENFASFSPASLIAVSGETSMGKSTLCANVARQFLEHGRRGVIFTTELTRRDYGEIFVSMLSGVDGMAIKRGRMAPAEWKRVSEAVGRISQMPMDIEFCRGWSVQRLAAVARQFHTRHPLQWIIVDYRERLALPNEHGDNTAKAVGAQVSSLSELAGELTVPLILVCQLSRNVSHRDSHRPILSDLRDSGEIEQIADAVLFVYRPSLHDPDIQAKFPNVAEIIIAKQRRGDANMKCLFKFDRQCATFTPLTDADCDAYSRYMRDRGT